MEGGGGGYRKVKEIKIMQRGEGQVRGRRANWQERWGLTPLDRLHHNLSSARATIILQNARA